MAWEAGLYRRVEEVLGYARGREAAAVAGVGGDCASAERVGVALDALAQACGSALVVGRDAGAAAPYQVDVVIAAGRGFEEAVSLGLSVDAVVTDADGELWTTAVTHGSPVLLHVHADNWPRALQAATAPAVVLTAQVPWHGCILAPLGFADGDRAVALAVALGCDEVILAGVDPDVAEGKFGVSASYINFFFKIAGYRRVGGAWRRERR